MLAFIAFDSQFWRLERIAENEANNVVHDLDAIHSKNLCPVINLILHDGFMEDLSADVDQLSCSLVIGEP